MSVPKVIVKANKIFNDISIEATTYEMLACVNNNVSQILKNFKKLSDEKIAEMILKVIRHGHRTNEDFIDFLKEYKNETKFKVLLAEKCICYESPKRHWMHFIGDMYIDNYLTLDEFKKIVDIFLDKSGGQLIILIAYCKDKIEADDPEYWRRISRESYEHADMSFNDFMYTIEQVGDAGEVNDDNKEYLSVLVGRKNFVDIFYDRAEYIDLEKCAMKRYCKPMKFNYNPFEFAVVNGSIKCLKVMILSAEEFGIKREDDCKLAKLCIESGSLETLRLIQQNILKRDFDENELIYSLETRRFDIARWIINTCKISKIVAHFIDDPVSLFFLSTAFDLGEFLRFKTSSFENTIVIVETSKNIKPTDIISCPNATSYLIAKNLIDVSKTFESIILNPIHLNAMLKLHKDQIELKPAHIMKAILNGKQQSMHILIDNGLKLSDLNQEDMICAAINSESMVLFKEILEIADFSRINFDHLTRAFKTYNRKFIALLYEKCNDIDIVQKHYLMFKNTSLSIPIKRRLDELNADFEELCNEILSDDEAF